MNPYSSGLLRRPSEYALQHALPLEIVHLILEYAGKMKNRNGKYMNQITPKDKRYYMLLRMPRIEPTVIGGWRITIKSMNFYGDRKNVYFNKFVFFFQKFPTEYKLIIEIVCIPNIFIYNIARRFS
jgi:hypothetical protein